jgi:hypothetical protein
MVPAASTATTLRVTVSSDVGVDSSVIALEAVLVVPTAAFSKVPLVSVTLVIVAIRGSEPSAK